MSVSRYYFQSLGDSEVICVEGTALAQTGPSTFLVLLHGKEVRKIDNVVMHWRGMSYEQIWDQIRRDALEHLHISGDEFMVHYFNQSTEFYGKPIYYSLTHLADLISEEYRARLNLEKKREPLEPESPERLSRVS